MQIVIEIPDEYYTELKYKSEFLRKMYNTARYNRAEIAILDGTPLPTGYFTRVVDGIYQCSNCKKYSGSITEYCAICGAKMRKGDNHEQSTNV